MILDDPEKISAAKRAVDMSESLDASLPAAPSYVVVRKATNRAEVETFSRSLVLRVNTDLFHVLPIGTYLQRFNAGEFRGN